MRSKSLVSILVVMCILVSMVPIQTAFADAIVLPDKTDELLSLNTEVMRKLCNTANDVYSFGLGEYYCPDDLAPGSYIIYIFGAVKTNWVRTRLSFTDTNNETSTVFVDKNSMTSLKVTVKEGNSFSLLHSEDGSFGVQCFISRWNRIGE